jgi:hypothetical protein
MPSTTPRIFFAMSLADKGWGMPSSPAGVKTSIEYMKSPRMKEILDTGGLDR